MVGALDLGFVYGKSGNGTTKILEKTQNGNVKILYLLGSDDINMDKIGKDVFVIYPTNSFEIIGRSLKIKNKSAEQFFDRNVIPDNFWRFLLPNRHTLL